MRDVDEKPYKMETNQWVYLNFTIRPTVDISVSDHILDEKIFEIIENCIIGDDAEPCDYEGSIEELGTLTANNDYEVEFKVKFDIVVYGTCTTYPGNYSSYDNYDDGSQEYSPTGGYIEDYEWGWLVKKLTSLPTIGKYIVPDDIKFTIYDFDEDGDIDLW